MKLLKFIFSKKYRKYKNYEKELKKLNPETNIFPSNMIPLNLVKFGKFSYGNPKIKSYGAEGEELIIGNFVSIAEEVTFLLSGEHNTDTLSTYPFEVMYFKNKKSEAICKGKIVVEDDVWIGYRATILSGVKIGKGAIVGAGAVVTKDLEPYGIYGGVPAKLIKYRFSKEIREKLIKIDFKRLEKIELKNELSLVYEKLTLEKLNVIEEKLK